jgi:hypothetical protein
VWTPTFLFAADFWLTKAVELDAPDAPGRSEDEQQTVDSVGYLEFEDVRPGAAMSD